MQFYEGDAGSVIPEEWYSEIKVNSDGIVSGGSLYSVQRNKIHHERIAYGDNLKKVKRCIECPLPKCNGARTCWYMNGKQKPVREKPKREPKPPKPPKPPVEKPPVEKKKKPPYGYDREVLLKGMVHAYTEKELAKALDISLYMTRKWLAWMMQEGK